MIYYYNGLPIQTPYSITSNRQTFEVETLSLKRSVLLTEAQRWELSFTVLTTGNEGSLLAAHTWNYHGVKQMIMPQLPVIRQGFTTGGIFEASVNNAAGSETVLVSATSGQTGPGTIPAGTFISFEGHSKVYVVKTTVNFMDAAENIPIKVFPNLVAPVLSGKLMNHGSNCLLSYRLDLTSGQGLIWQDGILMSPGIIKLVEALQ